MKNTQRYLTLAGITLILFFVSCDNNSGEEPCFICPADFSLIDYEPAWSPDGEWIAFMHGDTIPEKRGLYLISPAGNAIKQIGQGIFENLSWSPDGQWIAFSRNAQIWKMKTNGDSLEQLTFEGRNFFPTWSPDGQWIAFDAFIENQTSLYAIWRIEYDGNNKAVVAYSPNEAAIRMPHWNGNTIVHIRYLKGIFSSEIFSMDSNGEEVKRLTHNEATDYYPKLSVNNRIAFSSQSRNEPYFQIWTMDADGSNLKQLTDTQTYYNSDWSPDGKHIVYTDSRRENGRLWVMDENGGNKRQLTFEHYF